MFGSMLWVLVIWMKLVFFQSTCMNPVTIAHGHGSKHSNTKIVHPCLPMMIGATPRMCLIKVVQRSTTKPMSASGQAKMVVVTPVICGLPWYNEYSLYKPRTVVRGLVFLTPKSDTKTNLTQNRLTGWCQQNGTKHKTGKKVLQILEKSRICGFLVADAGLDVYLCDGLFLYLILRISPVAVPGESPWL